MIEDFTVTILYIGVFHENLKVSAFQLARVPLSKRAGSWNQTFNSDETDQLFLIATLGMKKFQQSGLILHFTEV